MARRRVLQLVSSFHQGGSERQAISLARMLSEQGDFDVSLATLNRDGVLLADAESIGLAPIPEFRLTSFYDINFIRKIREFARYLSENKIDLINTHDFYTNVFGMAAASICRLSARVASKRETREMRSRGQDVVERSAFRLSHAVVANCESVKNHVVNGGISASKVHVIHNGVDIARFNGEPITDQGGKTVCLVANLRHHVKNVPMLLRAARTVCDRGEEIRFVIAGEGELRRDLEGEAQDMGLADVVEFAGRVDDIRALLATSAVCVLTSQAEGFSNSILEYMAAGKPVIATRVGGAAEAIVEGITGYLIDSDDDHALAERIIRLVLDRDRAVEMGAAGRERVTACFSPDAQLRATCELYRSLLN